MTDANQALLIGFLGMLVTGVVIPIVTHWLNSKKLTEQGLEIAAVKGTVVAVAAEVTEVKHATDGLTEKLVVAAGDKARLLATAAEKVAQEDRETQQAKGAAAARQADAGAKVSTPLTMAAPLPEPGKETKP